MTTEKILAMRPFNLDEALAGAAVCTRDGKLIRKIVGVFPEMGFEQNLLVIDNNGAPCAHSTDGRFFVGGETSTWDLFMVGNESNYPTPAPCRRARSTSAAMTKLELTDIIDEKVIEQCEIAGACNSGLNWLRKSPRTYAELRNQSLDWYLWLASHKNYPATLELLSKDAAADVRRGIAQNPNTASATLELLSKDADAVVRRGIAQNPNTASATLELLSKDADAVVRRAAKKGLGRG